MAEFNSLFSTVNHLMWQAQVLAIGLPALAVLLTLTRFLFWMLLARPLGSFAPMAASFAVYGLAGLSVFTGHGWQAVLLGYSLASNLFGLAAGGSPGLNQLDDLRREFDSALSQIFSILG